MKYLVALLLLAVIGGGGALWFYLDGEITKPGPLAAEKIVYVAPGSVGAIGATLKKEGVIGDENIFRFAAWRLKKGGALKTGEYVFPAAASLAGVISILQSNNVYQHKLTIPEGLTSWEIVQIINKAEAMEGEIATIPAEGTLLPETYNYTYGMKRAALVTRMADGMTELLDEYWEKRTPDSLVKTREEAVVLASVIEKETSVTSERARIAGVFMNRLRDGWPLQSDPTVIYALTEGKGKLARALTRDDLNKPSPYNTYLNRGLPPTPIANPGRQSIIAALAPEKNAFFFFVADGTGGHAFARTNDEHAANVARWRQLQKQR